MLNREYICKPCLLCEVHDEEQVGSSLTAKKVARLQRRSQSKAKSWQRDFGASAALWHSLPRNYFTLCHNNQGVAGLSNSRRPN